MAEVIFEQRSFNKGEVSPSFLGRSDLAAYKQGLKQSQNSFVSEVGSVCKRPGLIYVDDLSAPGRIFPFSFSSDENYVIFMQEGLISIYKDDVFLAFAGGLIPPWSEEGLQELSYTQSADVLFLTHSNYIPHKLIRRGDDDWRLEQDLFDYWNYASQPLTWGDGTDAGDIAVDTVEATIRLVATPTRATNSNHLPISIVATIANAVSSNLVITLSFTVENYGGGGFNTPTLSPSEITIQSGSTQSNAASLAGSLPGAGSQRITISGTSTNSLSDIEDIVVVFFTGAQR